MTDSVVGGAKINGKALDKVSGGLQRRITKKLPHLAAAAELTYVALVSDSKCKSVRDALDEIGVLHHSGKTLDFERLYTEVVKAAPLALIAKHPKRARMLMSGGASLRRCIVLGLLVFLMTFGSYIITMRSEITFYQDRCANVVELFDPKRRNAMTFFEQLDKFAQMAFNKQHIQYCEGLQSKYGNMALNMATHLNDAMSSLKGRIALSVTIVGAISGFLSNGIKFLICLAAKWLGDLDTICDQACNDGAKKKSSPAAPPAAAHAAPASGSLSDEYDDE